MQRGPGPAFAVERGNELVTQDFDEFQFLVNRGKTPYRSPRDHLAVLAGHQRET